MKKTSIIALLMAATALSSFGQGNVNFNNRVTGAGGVVAPIYGPNSANPTLARSGNATTNGGAVDYTGHALLAGTSFSADLLAGADAGSLQAVAGTVVTFRTAAALAGFVTPPTVVPFIAATGPQVFQVRAWANGGDILSSYASALMAGRAVGQSAVFGPITPTAPPATPANLAGLTSFNLTIVPEPGVIALGVLGLGALLLRRRK